MIVAAEQASQQFDPKRLTQGRELKGLTKTSLAKSSGLSAASIGQYEAGLSKPTAPRLAKIALSLSLPVGFFATRSYSPRLIEGFFRSLRSASGLQKKQALAFVEIINEVVGVLEEYVRLPVLDLPSKIKDSSQWTIVKIEHLAKEVRQHFSLESGPIPNMVRLLETRGIVVSSVTGASKNLSAFSVPNFPRPIVVLNSDKCDKARSRFDAAHELGHLLMHDETEIGSQLIERQANTFASSFLMPADEIRDILPKRFSIAALTELKKHWGVSMAALLYRSHFLNVISDSAYQRANIRFSELGFKNNEPDILGIPERPVLFTKAFAAAKTRGISFTDIANKLSLPESTLREFIDSDLDNRPLLFDDFDDDPNNLTHMPSSGKVH